MSGYAHADACNFLEEFNFYMRISRHEFQRTTKESSLSPTRTGATPNVVWTVAGGKESDGEVSAIGIPLSSLTPTLNQPLEDFYGTINKKARIWVSRNGTS